MRILAIADEESKYLWDYFQKEKLEGIDLILSSGDLNPNYLSFLATFTTAPVLYVRGNHDDRYEKTPPDGCICIEDQIYVHEGVRILGLGGSMRYRPGINQYTEKEMKKRVKKLWFPLLYRGGFEYSSDPFSRLPVKRWSGSPTPGISGLQHSDGQVPPEIFYPRACTYVLRTESKTL